MWSDQKLQIIDLYYILVLILKKIFLYLYSQRRDVFVPPPIACQDITKGNLVQEVGTFKSTAVNNNISAICLRRAIYHYDVCNGLNIGLVQHSINWDIKPSQSWSLCEFKAVDCEEYNGQLPDCLKAQLVECSTSIAEVMGLNPFQAWTFSGFNFTTA